MKTDTCTCGRYSSILHCTSCGWQSVYAFAKSRDTIVIRQDGSREAIQTYKCRHCGNIFTEDDRRFRCDAPLPRTSRGIPPSDDADADATPNTDNANITNSVIVTADAANAAVATAIKVSTPTQTSVAKPQIQIPPHLMEALEEVKRRRGLK